MIKVLLVSPRLPPDNSYYCGDYAYTDLLLSYPPSEVTYYHYEDLIANRQAKRSRFWQATSYYLTKWGFLPPDMWVESLISDFTPDILHIYGFSARVSFSQMTRYPPVIIGAGTGSYSDLKYYHSWPASRIRRARRLKRWYLQMMAAHDSSLRPGKAAHILVWSEFSRQMHLQEGYVRPEKITVLPPGIPYPQVSCRDQSDTITFLFVGRDFERKNGPLVLEAFRRIHTKYPHTRLLLIGQPADGHSINESGVIHREFVPRDELLRDIYPQADVLLLPSKAEGFGLVIVEAMAMGLPTIAVEAWAMPEIIQHGENGLLIQPDSLDDLASAMQRLVMDSALLQAMKTQSLSVFKERFSVDAHNRKLREIYDQVLAET